MISISDLMKKTLTAALAAALVALPAAALAAPPPPMTQAEAQERVNLFIQRLAAYSQPYQAAAIEAEDIVLAVIDGANKALEMQVEEADEADMRAWYSGWSKEIRARQAALKKAQAALPPSVDVAFEEFGAPPTPELIALRRAFERSPIAIRQLFASAHALTDDTLPLIEKSIGDPAAAVPLASQLIKAMGVTLEAENVMLDVAIAGAQGHPQAFTSQSVKASNEALIPLLDAQAAMLQGGSIDRAALARTMRAKTAESRAAATAIPAAAEDLVVRSKSVGMGAELNAKFDGLLASYRKSSETELQLAAQIDEAALRIERGDDFGEAFEEAMAPVENLVNARLAQQQDRLRLLAQ